MVGVKLSYPTAVPNSKWRKWLYELEALLAEIFPLLPHHPFPESPEHGKRINIVGKREGSWNGLGRAWGLYGVGGRQLRTVLMVCWYIRPDGQHILVR